MTRLGHTVRVSAVALIFATAAWVQANAQGAPGTALPTLQVTMTPDAAGAWALALDTGTFVLASGAGQALVTVDGGEPMVIRAASFTLAALAPGLHEVIVELADANGVALVDAAEHRAAERVVIEVPDGVFPQDIVRAEIGLVDGQATGEVQTVRPQYNSGIALRWTSDRDVELHVHGFDIEIELGPEMPTTIMFVADLYGRFPTELHAAGQEATVLFVEVAP